MTGVRMLLVMSVREKHVELTSCLLMDDGRAAPGRTKQQEKRKQEKTGPVSFSSFFALFYAFRLNVTSSRGLFWAESGFRLP